MSIYLPVLWLFLFFFFQAEDGIRDLVRSRGLGDVYKRQLLLFVILFRSNVVNAQTGISWNAASDIVSANGNNLSLIHI